MKAIELLNLISRGRELPNKIKYNGYIFEYDINHKRYEAYFDEQIWVLQDFISIDDDLNNEVEIIEEEKELHANNIEFNIYDDKKEFIITLDENDLGIDKLHLDNCYFYKENDKWYVKHINLKPIAYISQEHKIPKKLKSYYDIGLEENCIYEDGKKINNVILGEPNSWGLIIDKINEILDYLEEKE